MIQEIDLQHLDAHWLDVISKAAQGALEKIDQESRKGSDSVSPEQVAIATMAGGFLYLYHLALHTLVMKRVYSKCYLQLRI